MSLIRGVSAKYFHPIMDESKIVETLDWPKSTLNYL